MLLTGDETFTITFFVDDEEYEKYYLVEFTIKSYGLMYHGIEVKAFFDVESFEITVPELYESHRYSFSPEGDVPYYQDHLYDGVRIYHILNQIYYVVYVDYGDKFERILVPMGQTPEIDEDYKPFGMIIIGWYYYDQALDHYIPYDFSYPLFNYAYLEADLEYEFYEITFVYMDELQEPYVTYIDAWYWMIDINIPTPPNYGINGIYFDPEYTTLVSYDYTFQQDTTLYVELIPLL